VTDFISKLFDTSDYPARWTCGNWTPFEGWLHIVSDALIFVAYFAIPASLFVLVRRREVEFPFIAWLFVAFIFFCGLTHAIEASIFWWPAYRLSGLVKAITAVVSLLTAVVVIRALPEAVALPSVRRANTDLQAALVRERTLARELESAHQTLEDRTSLLAVREHRMRGAAGAAKACALAWDVESGRIVWEIGHAEAMRSAGLGWQGELTHWTDLVGETGARSLQRASEEALAENRVLHRRFDLLGHEGVWDIRVTATPDARVKGEPATMTGMFGLMPATDSRADV